MSVLGSVLAHVLRCEVCLIGPFHMTTADIRINARLTGLDAVCFQELIRQSDGSVFDVLRLVVF